MPVHNPKVYCYTLVWALPRSLATTYGITIVFSSWGYLDVSVPPVSPWYTIYSCISTWVLNSGGFPHSDIHGSQAICASPWLFAACRVLHRLLVPRHPPYALISLTCLTRISFRFSFSIKWFVFYHRLNDLPKSHCIFRYLLPFLSSHHKLYLHYIIFKVH